MQSKVDFIQLMINKERGGGMENKDDDQATEHGSFNQGMYLEFLCSVVCGISLRSGQLIIELFPDCTMSCFSQVSFTPQGR